MEKTIQGRIQGCQRGEMVEVFLMLPPALSRPVSVREGSGESGAKEKKTVIGFSGIVQRDSCWPFQGS